MLKFLIVSPVVHVHREGRYGGYTPYVREMNLWLRHVDRVRIIAPLSQQPPDALETFYAHPNLEFVAVPALCFTNKKDVLSSLSKLPLVLFRLLQGMAWASHIHLRCPSNMGLLGLLVQVFFPFTRKTAKYANNWDWNSRQPRSYRLQQRLLRSRFWSRRMRVMVYGDWGERSRNIRPFFTASYSKTQALPLEPRSLTELPLRLIFVGTLTPNKGPLTAIKVVELLRGRGLEVRLDLFGDGRQRADLEQFCTEKGLVDVVHFHGRQAPEVVEEYFRAAHFLVFLSRSEGWPKVVAEAMWWACLPLTTEVSCVRQMLNTAERGVLVSADPGQVAEAIQGLLAQPQDYYDRCRAAMDWSHRYHLEAFEEALIKLL